MAPVHAGLLDSIPNAQNIRVKYIFCRDSGLGRASLKSQISAHP